MQQSVEQTASPNVAESAEDLEQLMASHLLLEIGASSPVLVIPRHLESPESFVFDLGAIAIANECRRDDTGDVVDVLTVETTDFRLDCDGHNIASNVEAHIELKRKLNALCAEPDNVITVDVPRYDATMRHQHYALILKLLEGNLSAEPLLSPIPYSVDHIRCADPLTTVNVVQSAEEPPPGSR